MASLEPLLHVDKAFVFEVDELGLGQLCSLVVELRDEPLQQHVLLLKVLIHRQIVMRVAHHAVLPRSRVVDVVHLLGLQVGRH